MYERHDPTSQALHQVVRENLETFYAAIEQGWESGRPAFVRGELSGYLDCSVLERGFAHLACKDCGLPRLVAFTCAGRGFCPRCMGRRMNQTTENVLGHVLPAQPLRQWVLTLPYPVRAQVAYEPGLMSLVARVFEDSLLCWYRQRLAPGNGTAHGGLLTVIQRNSGDMRLNPHLHVAADCAAAASSKPPKPHKTGRRCRYIKWAELLRLTFGVNVQECPACGGRMELRALVRDPESIERFLRHQGLWSPPPSLSPARAPPYHRRVARLRASTQQELFPDS